MERLSGLDAGFLYAETPAAPMHTLKVAVLDPAPGTPPTFADIRDGIGRRLPLLPPLRRRLVAVPLGLHHPVWVEDPGLDLRHHVGRHALPAPGTPAQLDALIADLAGQPLDRSRPLWRMDVVEGLEGGRLAVVVKVHHAVADGTAATALLAAAMGAPPNEGGGPGAGAPAEPVPGSGWLVAAALWDQATQLTRLPGLALRTAVGLGEALARRRRAPVAPPLPVVATPRTSLGGPLTADRSFARGVLPLDDVRLVRKALGVTVNDVVLAAVAGALRAELERRGDLPGRPLVAGVPVAADDDGPGTRMAGNRVSTLFTTLATDEPDPRRRLATIHQATAEAKAVQDVLGPGTLGAWLAYALPVPWSVLAGCYSRFGLARFHPPPINVVVSNVRGPAHPLDVDGAHLAAIASVGPVLEGIGCNVTVWSYVDQLHVGVLASRRSLPDPVRLVAGMAAALDELVAVATGAPGPAGPGLSGCRPACTSSPGRPAG